MKSFSNDADILRYETILFGDLHLRVQVLASGSGGAVSGAQFTAQDASFIDAGVEAGCVIWLDNTATHNSFYEVVSVDSATQLTVSILRDDRDGPVRPPQPATEVNYQICSYAPQANDAFIRLCGHFGITADEAATIPDISGLRQASVYLTIATVFATIAGREGFAQEYLDKSERYVDLFLDAVERCCFTVEKGGVTVTKRGGEMALTRE